MPLPPRHRPAMSTNPNDLPDRIDVESPAHLRLWATALGCRADDIQAAVEVCGPDVSRVREFIRDVQAGRGRKKLHLWAHEIAAAAIARGKSGTRGS